MKPPDVTRRYFYVDESGDATFFDRRKKLVLEKPGCSRHLMLGYVRTEQPKIVRGALARLRKQLGEDPLFSRIHSFKKTAKAFHAKDDSPEVRAEVFKLLRTLPVKGQFIFARKRVKTFRSAFHSKEGEFYDHLVRHLFTRSLHLATENQICFATRGSKSRQAPLTQAVERASAAFRVRHSPGQKTEVSVECQSPIGEPCLQVADYFLWAVQRVFTKRENRFYEVLEPQIEFVWDLYDNDNYPNNIYSRRNPLRAEKTSPL